MVDLNTRTFTVYNTVPGTDNSNPQYGFRKVINKCDAQQSFTTVENNNTSSITDKTIFFSLEIDTYLPPVFLSGGYYSLAEEDRVNYYTIAPGDFIVFEVVEDEIDHSSSKEFNELKNKYKNIGMTVGEAFAYLDGLPIDHIEGVSI